MYHKMDLNVSTKCKWTQEYVNTHIKHRQSFITYNIILESVRISSLKRTLIA